ncbi:hypothetical protein PoB_001945100 [Plakobranchus ocellatus]|uniref:Secreted protein n=1 Tax=Plakobranchus ocellatus TaxID=259542 RepID=A0AAV3Z0U5_9GAST|nr:hypothetical protein PoB_001945100 [Plakobranchus ocellatus]
MKSPHASPMVIFSLATVMFCHPALSAPHQRFPVNEFGNVLERPFHRFYLPIDIAPAALAGALKAHMRNTNGNDIGGDAESPYDLLQQKRTTSSLEMFEPPTADAHQQDLPYFSGIKRKMFWQPLGYMPASARAHHSNNKNGAANRNSAQDNGSNVFRYG